MKLNKLLALLSILCFISCNSELEQAPQSDDIVINVTTDGMSASRANAPATVEGYKLVCIMQLLNDRGETVGEQSTADYVDGKFSFTVKGTDRDNGAKQAVFWAEYQPESAAGQKVYKTDDLLNVTYSITEFNLADNNQIAAMEAYSGKLEDLTTGSVTLKRPLSKYTFAPTGTENAKDATTLEVTYSASGYNVSTQGTTATQNIKLSNANFDSNSGQWFVTYILCPSDLTYVNEGIKVVFGSREVTIPANQLPSEANYIYNITATIGSSDVNIDVTIDDSWNQGVDNNTPGGNEGETGDNPGNTGGDNPDENQPGNENTNYVLGSLIDADGNVTTDESKALAVYCHDGPLSDAETGYYPEFINAGKEIKGYAVALENVSETALKVSMKSSITFSELQGGGFLNTPALLPFISESDFGAAYSSWIGGHAITNENISSWFIPTYNQAVLYKKAYDGNYIDKESFLPTGAEVKYLCSEVKKSTTTSNSNSLRYVSPKLSTYDGSFGVSTNNFSTGPTVLCRPVITIFKDATN